MSISCKEKVNDFIDNLTSLNYRVTVVSKKPQLFRINNKIVNVRCTTMDKDPSAGGRFWYSININVLNEAEWFIYLMTTSDFFVMFPREFFKKYKDRMYPDKSKKNTLVFEIDWGNLEIVLKEGHVGINDYYYNLEDKEEFPSFK